MCHVHKIACCITIYKEASVSNSRTDVINSNENTYLNANLCYSSDYDCNRLKIHEKVKINITFWNAIYHPVAYEVDISNSFILGLDLLKNKKNFKLNFTRD